MGVEFGDELVVEECGIRLFCRHVIGTSQGSWQYMTTAPAKEQMLLYLNQASLPLFFAFGTLTPKAFAISSGVSVQLPFSEWL